MKPSAVTTLRVFIPFSLGYFLSYLFRVVNAVIAPDLVADLGLDPSELGLLTATYFIAFASSQLPLGVLLDRFGPRTVEAILLVFAGAGSLIFAASHSLAGVIAGRALIGFGVSACLMAAFKSYVLWFPREMWPRINGFQMAAGGLGALSATVPVEWALGVTDWRGLFTGLGILTLAIGGAVFLVVPEKEHPGEPERLASQIAGVRQVFSSRDFWRTAPLTTLSQAAFLAVQGLWAGPWLRDVAGLDRTASARVLSWTAAAMIAGFILLGLAAERLSRRGVPVLVTAVAGMGAFMAVQALLLTNTAAWAAPLWMGFGFFGTSGIIAYAALSQSFPAHLSGRVTTGINLLVFVAAFAAQWVIGAVIDLWPVREGLYHPSGYRAGFALILALQFLALAWFFIGGRTRNRH